MTISPARALIESMNMTCKSCALSYWHGREQALYCEWFEKPARYKCGNFRYEPGTDEREIG